MKYYEVIGFIHSESGEMQARFGVNEENRIAAVNHILRSVPFEVEIDMNDMDELPYNDEVGSAVKMDRLIGADEIEEDQMQGIEDAKNWSMSEMMNRRDELIIEARELRARLAEIESEVDLIDDRLRNELLII